MDVSAIFQGLVAATVGVGLAASCGFRVFVPLLVMSAAVKAGMLELSSGWEWVGNWPALGALACATLFEVGGYFVPWLDHLLDVAATPAAVIAGIVATAACTSHMDPLLEWSLAIIAGGGAAAAVQTATVVTRGASTATTGGLGNWVVSTFELALSFVTSILAILAPFLGVALCVIGVLVIRRMLKRRRAKLEAAALPAAETA
jgi:hypothetical protein